MPEMRVDRLWHKLYTEVIFDEPIAFS